MRPTGSMLMAGAVLIFATLAARPTTALATAGDPVIANVRASQRTANKLVDINYDVAATNAVTVSVAVSTNAGVTYDLPATHFSGDIGAGVTPGAGKTIVWDAGADWDGRYSAQMRVKVMADDGVTPPIPPDPTEEAPTPPNGVVSLIGESTAFLYSGPNPIQTGVATGTIDILRVAVLRGRVLDDKGAPLSGVTMTVNQHPEYGQTLTRTNGQYDLAVNGGGSLNLNFQKTGYLPVQRTLDVPWQDYVAVADAVMRPADTNVTVISLPSTNWQAARGGTVADGDGARRPMVLFPPGVSASIITYDGQTQEVGSLSLRLTEYTQGTNGPAAMPGDLGAAVAYTYAVELGADEAQSKVAGRDVLLSTNVLFYVDNFLGMPIGTAMPTGYYDRDMGSWVPSQNGRVILLLGTNAQGLARVSVAASQVEADDDTLAALGITAGERALLASLFQPATNALWRMAIAHLSTYDPNPGMVLAPGYYPPAPTLQTPNSTPNQTPTTGDGFGSLVGETGEFRETVPIAGTPYRLCYSSRRVTPEATTLRVELTGATIPPLLQEVKVTVDVAGRHFATNFAPQAGLSYTFQWDRYDAYGRLVSGQQPATVRVGYVYPAVYAAAATNLSASFGVATGVPIPGDIATRQPVELWRMLPVTLGWAPNILGGWAVDVHHTYDPMAQVVYHGDGSVRSAADTVWGREVVETYAGAGTAGFGGDNGPAFEALFNSPQGLATSPNGAVYLADTGNARVRLIIPSGRVRTVAGNGSAADSGDGEAATNAGVGAVTRVAFGADTTLYLSAPGHGRVRRVGTNGIITTVAGNGTTDYAGDGGPATQAGLPDVSGLAVAPDRAFYISDSVAHVVRRVGSDGTIVCFAGRPSSGGFSGDGGPAAQAQLSAPAGVALGPDGSLYIADRGNSRVRCVSPDGLIKTVAGTGSGTPSGDGGPATNACLGSDGPIDVSIGSDGTIFFAVALPWPAVRCVGGDGVIRTVAGCATNGLPMDGVPGTVAALDGLAGLVAGRDGNLYFTDAARHRLRNVLSIYPPVGGPSLAIATPDGQILHEFDAGGRHLHALHALTGATLLEFGYTNGWLCRITDGDGNATVIERSTNGSPQAIVSPDGLRTELGTNPDGLITSVRRPGGEATRYEYGAGGLLTAVVGARGEAFRYTVDYDTNGIAWRAVDPAGGGFALGRTRLTNCTAVAMTSAAGQVRSSRTVDLTSGDRYSLTEESAGWRLEKWTMISGVETQLDATGVESTRRLMPDSRFGMQTPIEALNVRRLPSGLTVSTEVVRVNAIGSAGLTNLIGMTNLTYFNGRRTQAAYTALNRQTSVTLPSGRQMWLWQDPQGRPLMTQIDGLAAVSNRYDSRGRLEHIALGAGASLREWTLTYDSRGFLASSTDPLGHTNRFERNANGQVTNSWLPDGSSVRLAYDAHGNLISVTPPGRAAHTFGYSLVDVVTNYTAPGAPPLVTRHNADRQVIEINRCGVQTLTFGYDAAGRPGTNDLAGNRVMFAYLTNGLVSSIASTGGVTIGYTYDGPLVTRLAVSGVITGTVAYTYDNDLRPIGESINGVYSVPYNYDADGLLTQAGMCLLDRAAASGLLTGRSMLIVTDAVACNLHGEITNLTVCSNVTPIISMTYGRDALGRVTNKAETVDGATFAAAYQYDRAGRLTAVVTNGTGVGTNIYAYDANGNRTNWIVDGTMGSASYDGQDRLQQLIRGSITNIYQYNAAGDLTNKTAGADVTSYAYDGVGNLMAVTLPGGTHITYRVDGLGRRVAKFVNGVFTQGFLYGLGRLPLAELDAQSNVLCRFVYTESSRTPLYMVRTGVAYRIVTDQLGSPRFIVQAGNGKIAQRISYDAWGRMLTNSAPGFQPFGFAGGLYDADTALVRFGARDYDADIGRWTTKDPALFAGSAFNLYAYALNDPVNGIDPSGLGPTIFSPGYQGPDWGQFGAGGAQMIGGTFGGMLSLFIAFGGPSVSWAAVPSFVNSLWSIGAGFYNIVASVVQPGRPTVQPPSIMALQLAVQINEHGLHLSEFGSNWHPELPPGYLPMSTQQHIMQTYGPHYESAPNSPNCYPLSI